MMVSLKQYILSIIISAIICGIVSQMVSDTKRKELMHLICGTILAITVLTPLRRINPEKILDFPEKVWNTGDVYIAEGERVAVQERSKCIKASCEAYILDKAKALGAEIRVEVFLNENQVPVFAEISGGSDPDVQRQLQNILTMDLGIPKENQKWIWNRESNNS